MLLLPLELSDRNGRNCCGLVINNLYCKLPLAKGSYVISVHLHTLNSVSVASFGYGSTPALGPGYQSYYMPFRARS